LDLLGIRTMVEADLDFVASCAAAEGWLTETREEFENFLTGGPQGCLIAEWEGRRAGVCVATCYGRQGFIGELIVQRTFRGKGLGPQLFERTVHYLQNRGCRLISLDSVPRAASFYASFGFRKICRSLRFKGRIQGGSCPAVRPMKTKDFFRVCDLDQQAFGADRSFFLGRRFLTEPELAKIHIENEQILGYIFGRRRGAVLWAGPWWVSPASADKAALLQDVALEAAQREISLGVLETNAQAAALLRSLGFQEMHAPSIRMTLGAGGPGVGLSPELFAIGTAAKG